jgi:hypothetical protein
MFPSLSSSLIRKAMLILWLSSHLGYALLEFGSNSGAWKAMRLHGQPMPKPSTAAYHFVWMEGEGARPVRARL